MQQMFYEKVLLLCSKQLVATVLTKVPNVVIPLPNCISTFHHLLLATITYFHYLKRLLASVCIDSSLRCSFIEYITTNTKVAPAQIRKLFASPSFFPKFHLVTAVKSKKPLYQTPTFYYTSTYDDLNQLKHSVAVLCSTSFSFTQKFNQFATEAFYMRRIKTSS